MKRATWLVLPVGAVVGAVAAGTVLADSQTVVDAPGDGRTGCEVLRATAGHGAGKLKHTVTMADAFERQSAPVVLIRGRPSEVGGGPKFVLRPGGVGVTTKLSADRKTVTYAIKPAKLRSEMEVPKTRRSYFWVANGCFAYPDWAPNTGSGDEKIKAHRFLP